MESPSWFSLSPQAILKELDANPSHGLSLSEVAHRQKQFGLNALPEPKADALGLIFFRQFQSPLIYILILASLAVYWLGETTDSLIILVVLLFNAVVGTIQEGRAQNTLRALRQLTDTQATVIRDGKEHVVSDTALVPGDLIVLREGEKVPADARLFEERNLAIEEAALTGESMPVHKHPTFRYDVASKVVPLGDQKNMVFKGTYVRSGFGRAIVVATGLKTQIGQISRALETIHTEIPLRLEINKLVHRLLAIVSGISLVLFILGLIAGYDVRHMFSLVISLAVSSIPEGLPVVLTLVLATGLWRMSRRNALIKKLQAVEALGQTDVIAVDKTGTITQNELMIAALYTDKKLYRIDGNGYEAKGGISFTNKPIKPSDHPGVLLAARIAAFAANAQIAFDQEKQQWQVTGDPTEAAFLVLSQKLGIERTKLLEDYPLVKEVPFSYERKYHLLVHTINKKPFLSVTGEPERILALCRLTSEEHAYLETVFHDLSSKGLRVIGYAYNERASGHEVHPHTLTFGGFFGMKDVLRSDVPEVVKKIRLAKLALVMITGDHRNTAQAIASEAGIYRKGDTILSGEEVEKLTPAELADRLDTTTVFARVSPQHKQHIVEAYRHRGEIIAMTGDGVNDAPSLVAADLGIGLGIKGTEVAKEAADIVLLDDNLKSIVAAIEEGRNIYKTLKKVILYLFSTSLGEVLTISGALLLAYPIPIAPAQIIWLNLVTDGFLDVSLAMEPHEEGLLLEKRQRRLLVDGPMLRRMLLMGTVMMLGALFLFGHYLSVDARKSSSVVLTLLAAFQWFNAWNCRHSERSVFSMGLVTNPYLLLATFVVIGLQILALHLPFLQEVLHTEPLALSEWVIIIVLASSILWVEEIRKFFARKQYQK